MRAICILFPLAIAGAVHAQQLDQAAFPQRQVLVNLDSGYHDNTSAVDQVVFRQTLRISQSTWLEAHFGITNLPNGSRVRLTGLADGEQASYDASLLAEWANRSAAFNGDRIEVELIAAPGTTANRVQLTHVQAGIVAALPESICGPVDNRTLSNDPRQGRLSTGCTGWLIGGDLGFTAGHCVSGGTYTLEFNVPLSSGGGQLRRPPVAEQFPFTILASGNDWALARLGNNNLRQTPAQRNGGQVYSLGAVPSGNQTIRITGYGTVSSPVSPTWNQVQKTHTGPLRSVSSSRINYATDTTGGNSGSPIIHENTGDAIGIHTNGGCNSVGSNYGWRIDLPALQGALQSAQPPIPGSITPFGTACSSSLGPFTMTMTGTPDTGQNLIARVANVPQTAATFLLVGGSNSIWNGNPLPSSLAPFGLAGCNVYVSIDVQASVPAFFLALGNPIAIPSDSRLIGSTVHFQTMAIEAAGAAFSNGVTVQIGGRL